MKAAGAIGLVFRHTVWQLVWGKKILLVAAAAALPIVLGILVGTVIPGGDRVDRFFLSTSMTLFVNLMLPLTAITFAIGLISDEVERGTLLYVITRPIPKWSIVVAKALAYVVVALTMVMVSVSGFYAVLLTKTGGADALAKVGGLMAVFPALLLGSAAYGGLFLAFGAIFRKPLIFGLIFAFGWENLLANLPGQTRLLSIVYHMRIMICRGSNEGTAYLPFHVKEGVGVPSATASAIALLGIFFVGVVVAIWNFNRKQYALSRVQ